MHQALRGQHVFHFAGADAESQRAERAVRGGVAVAANNGLARLRNPQFRPDDVHDALILAVHIEQPHAGFPAIPFQRFKLQLGVLVHDRQQAILGGHGVVHHREGQVGPPHFAPLSLQSGERLRRRAFMDEVAIDVNERGLAGFFVNHVAIPDFFVESGGCHGVIHIV